MSNKRQNNPESLTEQEKDETLSHYVNLVVQLAISPLVNKQWAA